MGATGAGKSTFIANATGQDVKIGPGLGSCMILKPIRRRNNTNRLTGAEEPEIFKGQINGKKVYFIDTPGFDDSGDLDDADILEMIAKYLHEFSTDNVQLTAILFLHKITDHRFTGSSKRLQRVFSQVCGHDSFKSVVLGTTMWDELGNESTGSQRETELMTRGFWGKMIQDGTDCCRLKNSKSSATQLAQILTGKPRTTLQLQTELQQYDGRVVRTSAGKELDRIYNERISRQIQRAALDEYEGEELKRLRAAQWRLQQTNVSSKIVSQLKDFTYIL